ncbi:acyltransferase [Pimelobacter simplex]|uniref:acyltransferase n=1 Tax=Nocardioides simplex TaxID=2045 RepID=UPI00382C9519
MSTPATEPADVEPGSPTAPAADPAATAWLSWLRVVAICGVVSIHTVGYNAAEPDSLHTMRGQLARLLDFGFNFAVAAFVMVSGAMMLDPARYQGPGAFLRKRTARLIPAVVFWHLWYVLFIRFVLERDMSLEEIAAATLNGRLYTALYFFWIVLGLSLLAPVLIPFVRDNGRRGALVAGLGAVAIPVLTLATVRLRGTGQVFADTALNWWFPYVGFFLLGYALRGVILRGVLLWLATAGVIVLAVFHAWAWRNPEVPVWLQTVSPVGYYSLSGTISVCLVYLVFQGHIRPGGTLGVLTRPLGVRIGRLLGDATLGVFALHLTVLYFVQQAEIGGPLPASPTTHDLVIRLGVVLLITWTLVLLLRRIPYVRSLL